MNKIKKARWTFDEIKLEIVKYKSLTEWSKKSKGSYSAASKNGWLPKLSQHFKRKIKPNNFWTKERVLKDSKKFKSRSEWNRKSPSAYSAAKKNDWFVEAVKHMDLIVEHGKWTKESILQSSLNFKHIKDWQKSYPAAYNKALKNGWLNLASKHMTAVPRISKWTKELVIADAKKYLTRGEWQKAKGNAASVAIKNGWYEESTKHMYKVYSFGEMTIYKLLTQLDIPFETQKRFKSIKSKNPLPFDFYLPTFNLVIEYQGSQHFYESNRKYGETLSDIQARDNIKRLGAKSNNLSFLAINQTLEKDIEDILIQKLKKLSLKNNFPFKKRALTNNELLLLRSLGTYSKEQVLADAKKYQSYPDWRKNSPLFQIAIKNGWLGDCKSHMLSEFESRSKAKLIWTKEKVIKLAKNFNSRSEFKSANSSAYSRARINGWLDEICSHMNLKIHPNGYWTKEKVLKSAKQFNTRTAWLRSSDSAAYNAARKNGWLEEACSHMIWQSTKPKKN
jgi:hypothetical protein